MVHLVLGVSALLAISKYRNKQLLSLSFLLLAIFAMLRYNFGNDYGSYFDAYEAIRGGGVVFETEIAFSLLNKVMPNFYLLIALTSAFFLYVVYRLIKGHLDGSFKGLAVIVFLINPYLFLMNLSSVRQCIAMCLFIIASKYLHERRPLAYILVILIATTFHISALVLLPICLIVNSKSIGRLQTLLLCGGALFLLVEGTLVTKVIETGIAIFDNSAYTHHFLQGTTNSLRATVLTGVYFVYVAINLVHLKGYKLLCGKLYLIGLLFGMLAFYFSMITRLQMYFDIFSVVAIPAIMEHYIRNASGKWRKLINLYLFPGLIFAIYLARYYTFFTNPLWESFNTYHTIFEAIL